MLDRRYAAVNLNWNMKIGKIKIIFALVLAFAAVCPATGQGKLTAPQVVAIMQQVLKNSGTMEFGFVFRAENSKGELINETDGTFVAEGECFKMNTPDLEMYCDGASKWLYDMLNDEITIFPHDPNTVEIAENPFAVLNRITPEAYTFRSGVKVMQDKGVTSYRVVMAPKDKSLSYSELAMTVNGTAWLPSEMEYQSVTGDRYIVKINRSGKVPVKGKDYFTPSEELLSNPDIYITDLR